uniref:Thrombomodulin n=1 Tax=Cyprinodon variegatus TaxID=28743 RepID=A0A3Q2CY78_CYPVA
MVLPAGLSVLLLLFLQAEAGGAERSSGYCIGNACFILFRDPSTFSSARERCRALGSHLMTVRTSVANDVLSVLLGNFSGSFWIGLHRLSGCPDPSKELRGFHWVTKDTESDFTNWLPGSDSSCLAARCVSVSREQRFRWSQAPCAQQAEGFLCENSFTEPCTSLPHEPQESVRYRTPDGIAVRLPSESKYICSGAPCEQNCVNTPGGYFCSCFEGYIEDENKPERCRLHCGEEECPAMCDPNNQFQCFCPDGFLLEERANGFFCLDMDECDFNFCSQSCKNTYGGYVCSCAPGFTLIDRHQCVIIDDEVTDGSPTTSTQTPPTTPHPEPTRRPSRVSAGGLVGIIVGHASLMLSKQEYPPTRPLIFSCNDLLQVAY